MAVARREHFIFNTFTIKLNRVHQICNYSRFDFIVKVPRNGCVRVLIQLYYLEYIVEGTIYNHPGYRKSIIQPKSLYLNYHLGLYSTNSLVISVPDPF